MSAAKNWFDHNGEAYARFRPDYPPELAAFLGGMAPSRQRAVDVGCGSGQLSVLLAGHFAEVIAVDPSPTQIASAAAYPGVRYVEAPAERLPLPDRSASLVTVAQAAHWFDLPAFYAEARRVAVLGAPLALVTYGESRLPPPLQPRFDRFYRDEIGGYWPPQRKLVDDAYRDIAFPFPERAAPEMEMHKQWSLAEFLGYVSTWSAVRNLRESGRAEVLDRFAHDLTALWGEPARRLPVTWAITIRLGTLVPDRH